MSTRAEEILDVAEEVLERVGADAFGVGELARALGIKPPSLYKHFDGVDGIVHALISRGLRRLGSALGGATDLAGFVRAYRSHALAAPQLYRLSTDRPIDRDRLEPGAELAGMRALLDLFGEDAADHPRARAAWAWAHGLVSLEIAGRFPDGADLQSSWDVLVAVLATETTGGAPG
ncbi:TetR/AcrR family transcriptional regulator [Microbacterium sp.]|uniref:TetR/AcrR family transcriptional regulator n=1 Tax=Microbacterium sp. TaxID=51671 RepID=UPI003341E3CF